MTHSVGDDKPMGMIETLLDRVEMTNDRLDGIESKLDRIWEMLNALSRSVESSGNKDDGTRRDLDLFEDGASLDKASNEDVSTSDVSEEPIMEPIYDGGRDEIEFEDEAPLHDDPHAMDADSVEDETTDGVPHWEDKEAYREYTLNVIVEMRTSGMPLKAIAQELTDMGLKTRSGKDKWSFGSVASILKREYES